MFCRTSTAVLRPCSFQVIAPCKRPYQARFPRGWKERRPTGRLVDQLVVLELGPAVRSIAGARRAGDRLVEVSLAQR